MMIMIIIITVIIIALHCNALLRGGRRVSEVSLGQGQGPKAAS